MSLYRYKSHKTKHYKVYIIVVKYPPLVKNYHLANFLWPLYVGSHFRGSGETNDLTSNALVQGHISGELNTLQEVLTVEKKKYDSWRVRTWGTKADGRQNISNWEYAWTIIFSAEERDAFL